MKVLLACIWLILTLSGCSPIETFEQASRQRGEAFAGAGDVVLRVEISDSLPNAFGRADLYGRTRDRGYVEMRYLGVNAAGQPVFRRREMDIRTNETVFNRMGMSTFSGSAQRLGDTVVMQGVGMNAGRANVAAIPGDAIDIVLDVRQGRTLVMRNHRIEVLDFNSAGVRFLVH